MARDLALRAAASVSGAPVERIRLEHLPSGQPVLAGAAAGLRISVSHVESRSGRPGVAAVAISKDVAVGVDAEVVRRLNAVALSTKWFSWQETQWISSLDPDLHDRAFLMLWTRKEALGKAFGDGLRSGGMRRPVLGGVLEPNPELQQLTPEMSLATPVFDTVVVTIAAQCDSGRVTVHRH
ncbi:4'-phosphopantetheinyl transferase family protein [Nocardia sp. NPDC101769]|uniref:4'-phosphopantetheinyl transferase family protein n=1 Tax=Nocardia sp. NPDC101769 TaxID=3364333 RepID=UPI0038096D89